MAVLIGGSWAITLARVNVLAKWNEAYRTFLACDVVNGGSR
jgi:hypothetical protein